MPLDRGRVLESHAKAAILRINAWSVLNSICILLCRKPEFWYGTSFLNGLLLPCAFAGPEKSLSERNESNLPKRASVAADKCPIQESLWNEMLVWKRGEPDRDRRRNDLGST